MRRSRAWIKPVRCRRLLIIPIHAAVSDHVGAQPHSMSLGATRASRVCAHVPCRRFDSVLTGEAAQLGANADRYSFIAVDLHQLLRTGFSGAPSTGLAPALHAGHKGPSWPMLFPTALGPQNRIDRSQAVVIDQRRYVVDQSAAVLCVMPSASSSAKNSVL